MQYHELGHAVVEYRTVGTAPDAAYALVDGEHVGITDPTGGGEPFGQMTRSEKLEAVAAFWGGWAAVHLAISNGHLPAEPAGVERRHGDRGFYGGEGSDECWVKHFSTLAEPSDASAFAEEARLMALGIVARELEHLPGLAAEMDGFGILTGDRLKEVLA